jgi:ketosteroid isomerase-like protein
VPRQVTDPTAAERNLRAMFVAFNDRDWDAFFEAVDPEFEYAPVEENIAYRGRETLIAYFESWYEAWEMYGNEPEEMIVTEDGRAYVGSRTVARGKKSGLNVQGRLFSVYRFREDKPLSGKEYSERAEALAAAGLKQ